MPVETNLAQKHRGMQEEFLQLLKKYYPKNFLIKGAINKIENTAMMVAINHERSQTKTKPAVKP